MPFGHHKKRSFLEGGKGFKLEAFSNDVYQLLPQLWHAMPPSEKRIVMAIMERNEGYTLKRLHELYFEAHVLYRTCKSCGCASRRPWRTRTTCTSACQPTTLGATLSRSWRRRSRRSCR